MKQTRPIPFDPICQAAAEFAVDEAASGKTPYQALLDLGLEWPGGAPDWHDVALYRAILIRREAGNTIPSKTRRSA